MSRLPNIMVNGELTLVRSGYSLHYCKNYLMQICNDPVGTALTNFGQCPRAIVIVVYKLALRVLGYIRGVA